MNATKTVPMVQPYLFFDGDCEQALEFYRKALGADVIMMLRYKDSPDPAVIQAGFENNIMHARFRVGDSVILAADGNCHGKQHFAGFSLALSAATEAEADRWFNALAEGGHVRMPLTKTFFSPRFGMLADQFGVVWMVMVRPSEPPQK